MRRIECGRMYDTPGRIPKRGGRNTRGEVQKGGLDGLHPGEVADMGARS